MSTITRRIIVCTLGILAGIAAWPIMELLLAYQASFSSYMLFSIVSGAVFGFVLGAFFGSAEGIIVSVKRRILIGSLTGAVAGLIGGIVGFSIGQGVLFLIGNSLFRSYSRIETFGLSIARAIGWAILGIFVGIGEGVRARSGKKILVGFLGGLIGGTLGGIVLEYTRVLFPTIGFARLIGLALFGLLIGVFYSIIEKRLAYGVLRVLNGNLKGKEYLIGQRRMRIGSSEKNEISITDYRNVEELHAVLKTRGDEVILERADPSRPVLVNDTEIERHVLKYEDVVQVGSAKFFYRFE